MPLRVSVDGAAAIDGETVRDTELLVDGTVDAASDGPIGMRVEEIGAVEAAVDRALETRGGGRD